jgi:hypothetical protein
MTTIGELPDEDIAQIKARILRGDKYSDIASDYRINQGRIADLKFGRIRPNILPAKFESDNTVPPRVKKNADQPSFL